MQHRRQSLRPIWVNHKNKACILCTHTALICLAHTSYTEHTKAHMYPQRSTEAHIKIIHTVIPMLYFRTTSHFKGLFPLRVVHFLCDFCYIRASSMPRVDTGLMIGQSRAHACASARERAPSCMHVKVRACVYVWRCARACVHMCLCFSTEPSPLKSVYQAEALLRTLGWQSVTPLTPGM